MAFKQQPLDQTQYSMKIIQDLGNIDTPSKTRKARYAIMECNNCKSHFKVRVGSTKSKQQTTCIDCANLKHNLSTDPLYAIWNGIKQRCYSSSRKDYHKYGGKGVTMCDEWKDSPIAFIQWCKANGWTPGTHIDKDIKSQELGIYPPIYSPETLSFVTPEQNIQAATEKKVQQYTLDGVLLSTHDSCTKAALALGKPKSFKSSIANCARGVTKSSLGFIWKFV